MNFKWNLSLWIVALALLLPHETALAQKPSSEGATLSFANLEDGAVIPPLYTVRFTISGMGIAPAGQDIDNTGHHHLLIDLAELPPMDRPLPANDHIRHFGKGQTFTELKLSEGSHTLQLLFADHTHTPHDPPVISDKVTVTVSADAPPQVEEEN